jgi:hypothetical protein
MANTPNLEQLLAETLPTPPSTLENARFLFTNDKATKPQRSRLGTVSALPEDSLQLCSSFDDDSLNTEHVVPDISTPTALPTAVAPMPDATQLAPPPTRRQLRKRGQRAQFQGLDTSDDEQVRLGGIERLGRIGVGLALGSVSDMGMWLSLCVSSMSLAWVFRV